MIFKSLIPSITLDNVPDYLTDVLDYQNEFKVFATPFENTYPCVIDLNSVDRIYDACIEGEDSTGDTLYNVSFRFMGVNGYNYYAYAHMRMNYDFANNFDEFIRGTLFITKLPKLFFTTTVTSIEQHDDIHSFLLDDGINLCFDELNLSTQAQICRNYYTIQILT